MTTTWRLGRRPALDGLRGVAVGLVVVSHVWDHAVLNLGPVGVTVFFVLSGFLITTLLLDEAAATGTFSYPGFLRRRAARLLPALAVVLVTVGTVQTLTGLAPVTSLVPVALYAGNWMDVVEAPMGLLSHTWSLAVEEQFYLVWPVVLGVVVGVVRPGRRRATLLAVAGGAALLSLALTPLLWSAHVHHDRVYYGSDTRAAGLLLGCALAAALHGRPVPSLPTRSALPVLGVAVVVGTLPGPWAHTVLAPSVAAVAGTWVVAVLATGAAPAVLLHPVVLWLGRRSYGVYLWHVPFVYGLEDLAGRHLALRLLAVALALVAAELSWRYVEQPVLRRARASVRPRRIPVAVG